MYLLVLLLFIVWSCGNKEDLSDNSDNREKVVKVTTVDSENMANHTVPYGKVRSLDGEWKIGQGQMDTAPNGFPSKVLVPGLVSSVQPAFEDVGIPSNRRKAFWYRRSFRLEPLKENERAFIKIYKAKYGTKVWINGREAGVNMLNFSSTKINVTDLLVRDREEQEIIIRVGAHIEQLPDTVTTGGEVEKFRYIPGIYDRVELIVTPPVSIEEVQIAADPGNDSVKIAWEYQNLLKRRMPATAKISIYDQTTGRLIIERSAESMKLGPEKTLYHTESLVVPGLRAWSPEDPQLYRLEICDGDYSYRTRFGARTFSVDTRFTNRALLNHHPYFFRGTNISLFRFFEDPVCRAQPWDRQWVRALHRKIKSMGMNSYRVSISALPAFWYEIADEEGIAIFAEFPMWYALKEGVSHANFELERKHPQRKYGIYPEQLTAQRLVNEYGAWMKELWNHASVIAWDAQNETWTPSTGTAINIVRRLDLSDRPWDNGWSPPAGPGDFREAHQYFARYQAGSEAENAFRKAQEPFQLSDLPDKEKIPNTLFAPYQYAYGEPLNDYAETPCVLNEYGYLWLNRDGSPTTLTKPYYDALLGANATVDARRFHYARMLAALTEYWRSARTCFGVLEAFMLGQSVPYGATSDHFIDVDRLELDPYFEEYVKDAFSPLGICLDYWEDPVPGGTTMDVPVVLTNDTDQPHTGTIHLMLSLQERRITEKRIFFEVGAHLQSRSFIRIHLPREPGAYKLVAVLESTSFQDVRSLREITVSN